MRRARLQPWRTLGLTLLLLYAFYSPARSFVNFRDGFHPDVLALQILLDRQHLSCNCIDGVWGTRTEIALMTWQSLNALPVTGVPDQEVLDKLGGTTGLLLHYTVTPADHSSTGPVPIDWHARSQMPAMRYESIQEKMAEQGHASQRLVARLNPDIALPNPAPGTKVILPDPAFAKPVKAGSLRITLSRREITVFDPQGKLIALFPCSIARNKNHRPAGEMHVTALAPNPNYTYDPQLFTPDSRNTTRLMIPPGPNNPVGLAWIGLSRKGYGIHGTPLPEHIGRAESRGCFRLANWNAVKLLQMVEFGTPVVIEE